MGSGIKARYEPLDLLPLRRLRMPPISAIKKQKDAQYCMQIVADAMEDLRNNDLELINDAFKSRRLATDAICVAVPYTGPNDPEARKTNVRACLTIGWAIGVREEVSGLAKSGAAELHHRYAVILASSQMDKDAEDWVATTFAFDAGYFLARVGDEGMVEVRSVLESRDN